MVKTYSLKKDGALKLSAHFRVREFAESGTDEVKVDEELITQLEALHTALSCSKIIITSGYRTDSKTSQHALGKAADVNCWHMVDGREVRYQGREILLAAEDVGFRGIGWIAGSAASRAAVHLDTRAGAYRFDEADGNRMVKDNSWYAYFGVEKPGAPGGGQAGPDACPYGEPTQLLQKGSTGDGVRWVQWQLSHVQGFEDVKVDSIFGAITDKRVREVQADAGIKVDGIVGPDTRKALVSCDETDEPDQPRTYTVVAGDSLSRIGSRLGVSWRDIAEANGIKEPWIIRPGQVLVIPE